MMPEKPKKTAKAMPNCWNEMEADSERYQCQEAIAIAAIFMR